MSPTQKDIEGTNLGCFLMYILLDNMIRVSVLGSFVLKCKTIVETDDNLPHYNGVFIAFSVLYLLSFMISVPILIIWLFKDLCFKKSTFLNVFVSIFIMPLLLITETTEFFYILFNGLSLYSPYHTILKPNKILIARNITIIFQTVFYWPLILYVPLFKGNYNTTDPD